MNDFLEGYGIVSSAQANALSVLFDVYKRTDACMNLEPMVFGHNHLSGFYYIAFENNSLSIVLTPQNEVRFMTTDYNNGNEEFFNTEEEAMKYLEKLDNPGMFIDDEEWEKEMGR